MATVQINIFLGKTPDSGVNRNILPTILFTPRNSWQNHIDLSFSVTSTHPVELKWACLFVCFIARKTSVTFLCFSQKSFSRVAQHLVPLESNVIPWGFGSAMGLYVIWKGIWVAVCCYLYPLEWSSSWILLHQMISVSNFKCWFL